MEAYKRVDEIERSPQQAAGNVLAGPDQRVSIPKGAFPARVSNDNQPRIIFYLLYEPYKSGGRMDEILTQCARQKAEWQALD